MQPGFAISDADIARARKDPAFKQRLLTETLDLLLSAMNRQQKSLVKPDDAARIREAGEWAARLADMIRELDEARHGKAPR